MTDTLKSRPAEETDYNEYVKGNSYRIAKPSWENGVDAAYAYLENKGKITNLRPFDGALILMAFVLGILLGIFIATI